MLRDIKTRLNDRIVVKRQRNGEVYEYPNEFDPKDAPVPEMTYTYPTLAQALQSSKLDLILLCLFNVLFYALAFIILNKYDVR